MTTTRAELHRLVDALPDDELDRARGRLEELTDPARRAEAEAAYAAFAREQGIPLEAIRADPFLRTLATAPIDDEEETEEERQAVAEARKSLAAGRGIPHAEARRRLLGAK